MPYEHDGEMKREPFKNTFISTQALTRTYANLGAIEIADEYVELHILDADHPRVIGTIKAKKEGGEQSNRVIFSLRFKTAHTLVKVPDSVQELSIVQVDKVSIDREFQSFGIASYAYSLLAKRGFTILSDTSQFMDGKMLWKQMATRAHLNSYKIYVLDDEYGFKEVNGVPIIYDGSNIDDSKIWTAGADMGGQHILLMMK